MQFASPVQQPRRTTSKPPASDPNAWNWLPKTLAVGPTDRMSELAEPIAEMPEVDIDPTSRYPDLCCCHQMQHAEQAPVVTCPATSGTAARNAT